MTVTQRAACIGCLMLASAGWIFWVGHHAEVTFADGLRSLRQAREIERGHIAEGLLHAVDHPMHPLAILGMHKLFGGGDVPYAWQTAAQGASALALVLAVLPLFLVARELYDDFTAFLGCVLLFANPVTVYISVNVLGQSTFLLFWAWGLYGAIRFLREGRFVWLPPTVLFGSLAYLTRPEGIVLHLALVGTLLLLPFHKATRIHWPRWWSALAFLVLGPVLLVGPYVSVKGGIATRQSVGRLLGTEPKAEPAGLERARPLPPDQGALASYSQAVGHVAVVLGRVVTWPFLPLVFLGLAVGNPGLERARLWLFLGVMLAISTAGLIRLQETAGYCEPRHALIPGVFLVFAASRGLTWMITRFSIDASRLGLGEGRLRPGPAVWGIAVFLALALPIYPALTPFNSGFARYRQAGTWIAEHREAEGKVLDTTDWSIYFSERSGATFKDVPRLATDPYTRYIVVRESQLTADNHVASLLRREIEGCPIVADYPASAPGGNRVMIYDLGASRAVEVAKRAEGAIEESSAVIRR